MPRALIALAAIVVAALIAGPALSMTGSSGEPSVPDADAPSPSPSVTNVQPGPSPSPSPSPSSSAKPSPKPSPSPSQQQQSPERAVQRRVSDIIGVVDDALDARTPNLYEGCLIDVGGIGPINLCV